MIQRSLNFWNKNKRTINTTWIIISSIAFLMLLQGCAGMRSVRGTKAYYSKKVDNNDAEEKISNDKNNDEFSDMLGEFENKFHKPSEEDENTGDQDLAYLNETESYNASNNLDATTNQNKKLPTLNEQVRSLSQGQDQIKTRVDNLQNDVDEIKGTLNDIKDVLYDMSGKENLPKTGADDKRKELHNSKQNSKPSNIILPDEKVNKKETEEKPQQKRKINTTKTQKNRSFTIKPVNYPNPGKDVTKAEKQDNKKKEPEIKEADLETKEKYNIAFSHFKNRRFNEAVNLFQDITESEKDPKILSDSYYWLGESYFGMEQYGKAMEYFRKVGSAGSNSKLDNAQAMIAECLIRSGQINDAKNAFKELIANFPESSFVPRARKMLQQL